MLPTIQLNRNKKKEMFTLIRQREPKEFNRLMCKFKVNYCVINIDNTAIMDDTVSSAVDRVMC